MAPAISDEIDQRRGRGRAAPAAPVATAASAAVARALIDAPGLRRAPSALARASRGVSSASPSAAAVGTGFFTKLGTSRGSAVQHRRGSGCV
jgi:hypothetical protein